MFISAVEQRDSVRHKYTFLYSFPLLFITGYWIEFPVLYSRTLLLIHSIYNSLHLLIPKSQYSPLQPSFPLSTTSLFVLCLWVCFCFIDKFICVVSFRWHILLMTVLTSVLQEDILWYRNVSRESFLKRLFSQNLLEHFLYPRSFP